MREIFVQLIIKKKSYPVRFFFAKVIEAFFSLHFYGHISHYCRQSAAAGDEKKKGQSIPQKKELCECIANADFYRRAFLLFGKSLRKNAQAKKKMVNFYCLRCAGGGECDYFFDARIYKGISMYFDVYTVNYYTVYICEMRRLRIG